MVVYWIFVQKDQVFQGFCSTTVKIVSPLLSRELLVQFCTQVSVLPPNFQASTKLSEDLAEYIFRVPRVPIMAVKGSARDFSGFENTDVQLWDSFMSGNSEDIFSVNRVHSAYSRSLLICYQIVYLLAELSFRNRATFYMMSGIPKSYYINRGICAK